MAALPCPRRPPLGRRGLARSGGAPLRGGCGFPVALIATLRPWPLRAHEVSSGLVVGGHATAERLDPLTRGAASALLASRSDRAISEASQEDAWELCRGNPLLVEQLNNSPLNRGEHIPDRTDHGPSRSTSWPASPGLDASTPSGAAEVADVRRQSLRARRLGLEIDRALEGLLRSGLVIEADEGLLASPIRCSRRPSTTIFPRPFVARPTRASSRSCPTAGWIRRRPRMRSGRTSSATWTRRSCLSVSAGRRSPLALSPSAFAIWRPRSGSVGTGSTPACCSALAEALVGIGRMDDASAVCERLLADRALPWPARMEGLRSLAAPSVLTEVTDPGERALGEAVEIALAHDPGARRSCCSTSRSARSGPVTGWTALSPSRSARANWCAEPTHCANARRRPGVTRPRPRRPGGNCGHVRH